MELHEKFGEFGKRAFESDPAFEAAMDKVAQLIQGFRLIINTLTDKTPAAESFAKYSDMLLKKSKNIPREEELDTKLTKLVTLFQYVDDKDIFQKFYARALAKRLIQSLSVSNEMELAVLSKLKVSCGYEYTSKLQRMFTDISVSQELSKTFELFVADNNLKLNGAFHVNVLTEGSWPLLGNLKEIKPPPEMDLNIQAFTRFYDTQFTGRKLTWYHHLSRWQVLLTYLDKPYELSLSMNQFLVIQTFNKAQKQDKTQVAEKCELGEEETDLILKQYEDCRILNITGDQVELNLRFSSKKLKLKLGQGVPDKTERKQVIKSVDEDRKLFLQATIVRIMKARKQCTHAELVAQVIQQSKSRFEPQVGAIKKNIETMIEKEFIKRGVGSNYEYVC